MEKISHILPASRRVTAVDTESSQPVRPGAPEFGRSSRTSQAMDVQDRVSLSSIANGRSPEAQSQQPLTYKNPKDSARAKAVDEIAEKFFNPRTFAKDGEETLSEETLRSMQNSQNLKNVVLND